MPPTGRLNDLSENKADAHACPACPHPAVGPAIVGSPDVLVNGLPMVRLTDMGMHGSCCGPNTWLAFEGSSTVAANGLPAHRLGDKVQHCGGMGELITGSENVLIGGAPTTSPWPPGEIPEPPEPEEEDEETPLEEMSDPELAEAIKSGELSPEETEKALGLVKDKNVLKDLIKGGELPPSTTEQALQALEKHKDYSEEEDGPFVREHRGGERAAHR